MIASEILAPTVHGELKKEMVNITNIFKTHNKIVFNSYVFKIGHNPFHKNQHFEVIISVETDRYIIILSRMLYLYK